MLGWKKTTKNKKIAGRESEIKFYRRHHRDGVTRS
jgi:hypothetical protein